jgi:trigger factor
LPLHGDPLTRTPNSRIFHALMTPPTLEHVPGSKVKMVFRVTPEEAQPYLDEAVRALGESKPVPGFRPGKAPYAEIVKQHGEMRIWETALERIVRSSYLKAVLDLDIDTVGSPEVQVDKLTPGQEIGFTVIAPIAPTVKTLAAYDKELVEFKPREVSDEDIERPSRICVACSARKSCRQKRRQRRIL